MSQSTEVLRPAPAFQLYASDLLADEHFKLMTLSERGLFLSMLAQCWVNGSVPGDAAALARVLGLADSDVAAALPGVRNSFCLNGKGRLECAELKRQEAKIAARREERSTSGKRGAESRWTGGSKAAPSTGEMAEPMAEPLPAARTQAEVNSTEESGSEENADPKEHECPLNELVQLYHEALPASPKCLKITPMRATALRARWRECRNPVGASFGYGTREEGLVKWREFFERVSRSDFLTGKTNGSSVRPPFLVTLDWLLKHANFLKVIEGAYDNRVDDRWWQTHDGIERKGQELGIGARGGENYNQYRDRLFSAIQSGHSPRA